MSCRNRRSTCWPCGECPTSGWYCTPASRRSRSSNAATAARSDAAVTVKPSGARTTESPWLIHTGCRAGRPSCRDPASSRRSARCGRTRASRPARPRRRAPAPSPGSRSTGPAPARPTVNSSGSTRRRARLVHARRAAGEDQRGGLAGEDLLDGRVAGHDLGVDLRLPHPAGDQLGVLRPVVDDEDRGRLHPTQGSQYLSRACLRSGPHPVFAQCRRVPRRVRAFTCPDCSSLVPFDSTRCLVSDSDLGYSRADRAMQVLHDGRTAGGLVRCTNTGIAACNWLTTPDRPLCDCCALTRTRPADGDTAALADVRPHRGRQAPAALPARRPRAAGRRPGRGPRRRPGVRPAVQRARER